MADTSTVIDVPATAERGRRHRHERDLPLYVSTAEKLSPPQQLAEIARDMRRSRDLLYQLTRRDIRIRYKQAVMGFGWALFMPILVVSAGMLVRFAMAYVSGGEVEGSELSGMAIKAVAWSFFVGAIGFATPSLIGSQGLVTKIYFPREVLPTSSVLAQGFDSLVGAVGLALLLPFLGATLSLQLFWILPIVLLLFVFTLAAGIFLACANLFFRDVKYIVQVMLTFGIFFTPVLFEPVMFGALGARIIMLNPVSPFLEALRLSIVEGHNLLVPLVEVSRTGVPILAWSPWYLLYGAIWAVAGMVLSLLIFRRASLTFAENV